ncbi:MAG: DNA repair protein RecN [Gammaproteobacteria bacterium]|nr:DNA repair protein RecN [Gammaproteobacteria bacterium]MDE0366979.1 DNA repair protein RecN [Gammaproteobacteria bacterium]
MIFPAIVKALLRQLTISNFALVGALDIDFAGGLTVITGESGAGKSILLNALALVLGERASTALIRPGAARAEVTAEFDIQGAAGILECLGSHDLADPDQPERCLLRRVIGSDGRSRAFVNGTPVNLHRLRQLAGDLVDVHGQDENQRLVRREVQLALLDAYGVAPGLRDSMADAHRAWKRTRQAAQALRKNLAEIDNRSELLRYQLAELDALNPGEGEFETLDAEFRRLSQAQTIRDTVAEALEGLVSGADELRRAQGLLGGINDAHPALDRAGQALESAVEINDDAMRDLRGYFDALDTNPDHLAEIGERLNLVQDLARKHRVRPEGLAGRWQALKSELATLGACRDDLDAAEKKAAGHRQEFERTAGEVSRQRRAAASGFADEVSACMETLGIGGGRLCVRFEDAETEQGLESAEFLVSANPNYAPGSLRKVASGGERARISLAIEVVAAERARLPCLVLDEADVGVGGPASDVIGRMLRRLGRRTQVICVTHAPQVAALGDAHLLVEKDAEQEIFLHCLDDEARIEELARMLAGTGVTQESRTYARTLRQEAGDAFP